jgi:hypothetical protein
VVNNKKKVEVSMPFVMSMVNGFGFGIGAIVAAEIMMKLFHMGVCH